MSRIPAPLNYLILIQHIDLLPAIYGEVLIPPAVQDEMLDSRAPALIRAWIAAPPPWLEVRTPHRLTIALHPALDAGELEAIALAHDSSQNSLLLIDERIGRREATRLGIKVTGTLGILEEAARRGLLDFREAVTRLRATSFNATDELLEAFLLRNGIPRT